jgi:hypothetical protein
MKRLSLLALVAITVTGCGGSSSSSPLRGNYAGTWNRTIFQDSGTLNFEITNNGSINGTVTRLFQSNTSEGTVKGNVGDNKFTLTMTFPNGTLTANGGITVTTLAGKRHITGSGEAGNTLFQMEVSEL